MAAPLPEHEAQRLKALRAEEILDSLPEADFDDLARLAAFICGTPVALVSLVDESRQWFKARVGLDVQETHRDLAFCAHTILKPDDVMIVEDAKKDKRFSQNPLVSGDPKIRFYAGAPLVTKDGFALGSLCVIDRVPRKLTAEQIDALKMLSNQVIRQMEHRRSSLVLEQSFRMLQRSEEDYKALSATLEDKVQERTNEITEQSNNLKALMSRFVAAQEDERRRLARELHDSAGQLLAGAGMHLSVVIAAVKTGEPRVLRAAEECGSLIDQLNTEIRTMSYLLHPPLLEELGLASALKAYAQGLEGRSALHVTVDIGKDFPRLDGNMELVLFRVVQECLTNVHRHSGAKAATIHLFVQSHEVILQVQDEGKGMPPEKLKSIRSKGSGVGMQGMRERVEQLHGKMEIESAKSGTLVTFRVPMVKPTA